MVSATEVLRLRGEGLKQREVAQRLDVSRARVANVERTAKRAQPHWLQWVEREQLSLKHVEAALRLPSAQADSLLRQAIAGRWSYAQTLLQAQALKGKRIEGQAHVDPDVARLENDLSVLLGTAVAINTKAGTRGGNLVLKFTDPETLDGLLDRLGYRP